LQFILLNDIKTTTDIFIQITGLYVKISAANMDFKQNYWTELTGKFFLEINFA